MTKRKKVAILISGNGSNMKALLLDMIDKNHPAEPVLVLSDRINTKGIHFAKQMNVKTEVVNYQEFENQAVFEEKLANLILASDADLICLAGFMCILSPIFVDRFKDSILNIHPSLLPLFPGLDTHKKVIASGMAVHGATVHIVTNKLDCGRILGQCVVPVFKSDSQQTLAARLLKQEHELYKQVVRKFIIGEDELLLLS